MPNETKLVKFPREVECNSFISYSLNMGVGHHNIHLATLNFSDDIII